MRALRTAWIWTMAGLLTVVFGLPSIVAAFLTPHGDGFAAFARGWARSVLWVAGMPVEARHRSRVVKGRSYVVAPNHESFVDILVLFSALPTTVRFMAKRSIFRVPVLGWAIAAAGFVPVDRGDRKSAGTSVDIALRRLRDGRSLVLFPEETRGSGGDLLPFKRGAELLALRAGLPLLPVGIAGTAARLPRGSLRVTPGPVAIAIGEEIAAEGEKGSTTSRLREEISRLREEARGMLAPAAESRRER
ncbi:MAG TPA: lysophospholipid acyltransferase family protein [Thermoanaerobaculia bacterium]|jgi:1-acyl-sn-glycerol-3-phosphate acyltransferase